VTVSVAMPALAATAVSPVTVPVPEDFANVIESVLSVPDVTVFPAASSIVAVSTRVVPDARLPVDPLSTIFDAVPNVTVNVRLFEVTALPPYVPVPSTVTEPARAPVTISLAMPPETVTVAKPVTVPGPAVAPKVTVSELSPVAMLPEVSSKVAVSVRVVPEARAEVDPLSTIWLGLPEASVTSAAALVAVHDCHRAVTVYV